ncbi:MAG: multiheme c-type cytochrome [Anaerolineales bacterium]
MRRLIVFASGLLLLTLLGIAWWDSHRIKPVALIPSLTGKVEYCLTCHSDLPQIDKSHPVAVFGCVICHGGEPLALDETLAHSTLRGGANPSDFSVVQQSCGGPNCHSGLASTASDQIPRATTSIQDTYAGAIAIMRYAYGAQSSLMALFGTSAIQDSQSTSGITSLQAFDPATQTNPQLQLFGQNCLACHLSAQPLQGSAYARFTGCSACHTPTAGTPLPVLGENGGSQGLVHKLTTAIPYTQCNTCHNRGNYDLRSMTFQPRTDTPTNRLQDYYQPIAQFTQCEYTLDCIDCHTGIEAMGNGSLYSSETDIQYIQCKTCHGTPTQLPLTRTLTDPNDLAFTLAQLNPVVKLQLGDTILVTDKGEPLWNTRLLPDGTYELIGKATGQVFPFKPVMGSGCLQDPNDQSSDSCHACHSVQR